MKIKYFSYIAEQSFLTSPKGERLFFHVGGVWSRPYIIPDPETEARLFRKQLWFLRICFGVLILNKPFLLLAMPKLIVSLLWWFVIDFVFIMSVCWLVYWLFFRTELPKLQRASTPISLFAFYRESAKRDSTVGLVFGFLLCLVFIWAGFWIIRTEFYFWIGWMIIIFSGLCALSWGYTLFLKLTMPKDREVGDRESEA